MPRETPESSTLPLIEAGAVAADLPRAFGLAAELEAAGYFEASLMGQWNLLHDLLAEHAREAPDPLAPALAFARHDDARVRFLAPGMVARLMQGRPVEALAVLRPIAADTDFRVAEAVQAFGIRPQLDELEEESVALLRDWVADPVPHVRRAAVEAVRPRGVWVKRLTWAQTSPALLLPLVEPLREESERYVANAVGNLLNDISKDHPRLVIDVGQRWIAEAPDGPHTRRIVAKALRTLVKEGDPFALEVFGLGELDVSAKARLRSGKKAAPNSTLRFVLTVENAGDEADANLVYEIEMPGKNPARPRRKRYQAGTVSLAGQATTVIERRERIFDRRDTPLLPGACRTRFFLNGHSVAEVAFELVR